MYMNKRFSILLAVVALIVSTLACAVGEPSLSNVRTTKDQDGAQPSAVFSTTDTIYVVTDLSNGVKGNAVSLKWYTVDVVGYDPNTLLDEAEIPIEEDTFNGTVYFSIPPPLDGGTYKAEVYFNGALNNTVQFTVQ
jgi:hypothetical protein